MQGRQLLTPRIESRQRPRSGFRFGLWLAVAVWLCTQLAVTGIGHGKSQKLGPNEIQSGYRAVLSILSTGDREAALEALFELESAVVGDKQPWKRVEDFWRLKLRTLRELLDAESLALLKPVIMLHYEASQIYVERERPFLASHSRVMSVELAEIYADRANSGAAREFSGWVMTSLGASLWHPSSVISSADLFFRAQMVDPRNPIALMGLGAAYERKANYQKSIEYLSRLLEMEPDDSVAALHLALCQVRSNVTLRDEGLQTLKGLQSPEEQTWVRSIAYQEVARAQLADEAVEAAEATIREGLEALPGDQQLALQLALILEGKRRPKEALGVIGTIEPGEAEIPSPRLLYDVWEPTGMQEIRVRLEKDAALGLPILAGKMGVGAPAEGGQ